MLNTKEISDKIFNDVNNLYIQEIASNYVKMDGRVGVAAYLDLNYDQSNDLKLKTFTRFVELKKYQVAASVTREQIFDLSNDFGIDVTTMVNNALSTEIIHSITKEFNIELFKLGEISYEKRLKWYDKLIVKFFKKYKKTVKIKTSKDISSFISNFANQILKETRKSKANFAVTNSKIASFLQESEQFKVIDQSTVEFFSTQPFCVGTILGVKIFVDPNMSWSDDRILFGLKNETGTGLNFAYNEDVELLNVVEPNAFAPQIKILINSTVFNTGFYPEKNYLTVYLKLPKNSF